MMPVRTVLERANTTGTGMYSLNGFPEFGIPDINRTIGIKGRKSTSGFSRKYSFPIGTKTKVISVFTPQ